ncbi:hypothetical protein WR25_24150 [Diploscapter pachys]|uniref:Uncharacterized protein n=1 Tax=Diploscapter pachys TaxID=2018661 RepID=A0A2A2M3Q6_9BILA|nr:hypothetical protein WR25_24150 [Diploscapter pachys]
MHQLTHVHPHIAVDQAALVTVAGRIALFVALHIDLDDIAFHRHLDPEGPGHVDARAIVHQAAQPGTDGHLAAGGQGQGALLEMHGAAADHLHPRLLGAVDDLAQVVEAARGIVAADPIHTLPRGLALAVQGLAVVEQHGGDAALAETDRAAGVAGRVEQVDAAAPVNRSAGKGHAILAHGMASQGDITACRLDQSVVDHAAAAAAGLQAAGDLVATGGGEGVGLGAPAPADVEVVTGGKRCLALGCDDLAFVVHLAAQQQHIAAALGGGGWGAGLQLRATLHHDLAAGLARVRGTARR